MHELDLFILNLLQEVSWPSRRAISGEVGAVYRRPGSHLIFRHLNSLCRNERIYCSDQIKEADDHSIYSLRPWAEMAAAEVERCKRMIVTKCEALNTKVTRKMGKLGATGIR